MTQKSRTVVALASLAFVSSQTYLGYLLEGLRPNILSLQLTFDAGCYWDILGQWGELGRDEYRGHFAYDGVHALVYAAFGYLPRHPRWSLRAGRRAGDGPDGLDPARGRAPRSDREPAPAARAGGALRGAAIYGAERRGAPVAAFTGFGREPIRERGVIAHPDLVMVADASLLEDPAARVADGITDQIILFVNSPLQAEQIRTQSGLPGRITTLG